MELQYYALAIFLTWLPLAALTAFIGEYLGSWSLGRSAGVLLVVMAAFFVEHFIGFGTLGWGWLLSIPAAFYLWSRWPKLKTSGFIGSEAVFAAAFAYGLLWKFLLPSIYPTAERLTDMVFVGNYYGGTTLPPVDNWYPPFKFDFYYALQHYGAALLGRMFRMPVGLATNIGFILLMALPITLAWEFAGRFISRKWPKLLLVAALACGGTGASVFTPLVFQPEAELSPPAKSNVVIGRMWGSARFIGHYDQLANTEFGNRWLTKWNSEDPKFRNLPLENFGYQYFVGDYHPPIGGFFLLLLGVALIGALELPRQKESRPSSVQARQALLALTVPAVLATNTWVFPLQGLMVGSWALWRQYQSRKDPARAISWKALIGGGIAGFVLLYPFLIGFCDRSDGTHFTLVKNHTPLIPFLMQLWPLLLLMALVLFDRSFARPALFLGGLFIGLLLFTEVVRMDDITVGQYERTNSTLKWWGWIWTGGLVALGAPLLGSGRMWVRGVSAAALTGITLVYAVHTFDYLQDVNMGRKGKLRGDAVYTQEPPVRAMFRYLAAAPDGIVLENMYTEAYHDGGAYAAFATKPLVLGWPAHEVVWRGKVMEAMQRRDQIRFFYAGTLEQPVAWLRAHNVDYIVWNQRDAEAPDVWPRLNEQLKGAYGWHSFGFVNGREVGLWVRVGQD